jgi:hypothetical protein
MNPERKSWNERHKRLRQALLASDKGTALETFLVQHAIVHSARMSKSHLFSFEDEILNGLPEQQFREIAPKWNHSIAWIMWHIARVEDVVMNLLVAGTSQILLEDNWHGRIGARVLHTGNGSTGNEVRDLSQSVDPHHLRMYRIAVGRKTRKVVKRLCSDEYGTKVDPSRIQRIWDEGAVLTQAKSIVDYWASRTIGELLLMPPLRHCFLHLNEARRIRHALDKRKLPEAGREPGSL